jgi:hypothetical protein
MSQNANGETVLVTGGSGYLGGWMIVELRRRGYTVRTTVRSLAREAEVRAAIARQIEIADRLSVYPADLLRDEGWDCAVEGAALSSAPPRPCRSASSRVRTSSHRRARGPDACSKPLSGRATAASSRPRRCRLRCRHPARPMARRPTRSDEPSVPSKRKRVLDGATAQLRTLSSAARKIWWRRGWREVYSGQQALRQRELCLRPLRAISVHKQTFGIRPKN